MAAEQPKIEEITDDVDAQEVTDGSNVVVHNRNERKARKLISKLGLKKVDGISRVFFRSGRGSMFSIHEPEVFKNPATGTYIVFGEAKTDNLQPNLANLQEMLGNSGAAGAADASGADAEGKAPKDQASIQADMEAAAANLSLNKGGEVEEIDDADVDTSGLDEENIKIVMDQANASKAKAVAALRKNKSDIVNTIMELTT